MVTLPHHLDNNGIHLFYGALARAKVDYANIAGVELNSCRSPGGRDGLHWASKENSAYLAVRSKTNLSIKLKTAKVLLGWSSQTPPVTTIHVAADEPERMVRELGSRISVGSNTTPLTQK